MVIAAIKQSGFEASAEREGSVISLRLRGDASGDALEPFERLLEDIHENALQNATSEANVDIRELEFMSSSCFKCLVTWVTEIQAADEAKQYPLRFASNADIAWQKRSLRSLHFFAVDLVKIEG
jgi:hypothetical protein